MLTNGDLLYGKRDGRDEAFLTARTINFATISDGRTVRQLCVVEVFRGDTAASYHPEKYGCLSLREARSAKGPPYLFSGGAALFIQQNEPLIFLGQRDPHIVDGGKWTTPAGRCAGDPLDCCWKELQEEAVIVVELAGKERVLYFEGPHDYRQTAVEARKKTPAADVAEFHPVVPKTFLPIVNCDLQVHIDNDSCVCVKDVFAWFDRANNTLEFRLPLEVYLDGWKISRCYYPESASQTAKVFTIEEMGELLQQSRLVPAAAEIAKILLRDAALNRARTDKKPA